MDPLHQDRNKQLPQAPMPGGFEATSQPGYNPALNPATDPMYQQGEHHNGGLRHQGEHQNDGLLQHQNGGLHNQREHHNGGLHQDGLQQGGLDQGGLHQGGLHQGGLDQGGLHQGGLHQGGLHQGGLDQGGLHQGGLDQGGLHKSGLHQGGLDQGGLHQSGLHQGGLHQGGLDQGGLHQSGLHQGGLHQGGLDQGGLYQNDVKKNSGLHANNPRNNDTGLSHNQQIGAHHHDGTQAHHAHHTHQGAAVLPSTANYGNNDDLSNPSSTTATHGSVDSRKDFENPSTAKGIKDTLAGNLQKIAGALTGNDQRRAKGETMAQEGKIQVNAAKTQPAGKNGIVEGHGRGDLQGTHLHDNKELERSAEVGGHVPPVGHGRGGLANKEIGNDSVFANANTGKAAGAGYGRGGLEGLASREE